MSIQAARGCVNDSEDYGDGATVVRKPDERLLCCISLATNMTHQGLDLTSEFVINRSNTKSISLQERAARDNCGTFVAIEKHTGKGNASDQKLRLLHNIGKLVMGGILRL